MHGNVPVALSSITARLLDWLWAPARSWLSLGKFIVATVPCFRRAGERTTSNALSLHLSTPSRQSIRVTCVFEASSFSPCANLCMISTTPNLGSVKDQTPWVVDRYLLFQGQIHAGVVFHQYQEGTQACNMSMSLLKRNRNRVHINGDSIHCLFHVKFKPGSPCQMLCNTQKTRPYRGSIRGLEYLQACKVFLISLKGTKRPSPMGCHQP